MIFESEHYWLLQATVPACLIEPADPQLVPDVDGLVLVDLEIYQGKLRAIAPTGQLQPVLAPVLDLKRRMVLPSFVDIHTHLDKGHIWPRRPNPDGTFNQALQVVEQDATAHWTLEDVYRRMAFGLQCSYAHGTRALRTHIDAMGAQAEISLTAFQMLQQEWRDRLVLQVVSLVPIAYFSTPAGEQLADRIAEVGGVLGGLTVSDPDLDQHLDRVFSLAQERNLDLDFHTDESNNPDDKTLQQVAAAALRHQFPGKILCGHCCSLAVQSEAEANQTIALVKDAGLNVVSLPMCNLYLQGRLPAQTPRWRGVTLVHELKQQGVPVALASDNCRDPFHGFGDHDMLEVFEDSAKIAHLDRPYGDWIRAVTSIPADIMGLPSMGRLALNQAADLIIFKGRNFSELLSRPQPDRIVIQAGNPIDAYLPDYSELDDLITQPPQKSPQPA